MEKNILNGIIGCIINHTRCVVTSLTHGLSLSNGCCGQELIQKPQRDIPRDLVLA